MVYKNLLSLILLSAITTSYAEHPEEMNEEYRNRVEKYEKWLNEHREYSKKTRECCEQYPLLTEIDEEEDIFIPREPESYTTSVDSELQENVLLHCPARIKEIINMWKKRVADHDAHVTNKALAFLLPKELLLVGPAGTGKSTIGKIIAAACGMPCFMFKAPLIANEYICSGSQNLEKIFIHASFLEKPCVIIIDEIETLFKQHKQSNHSHSDMITALWTLLDEYKDEPILFIATTNSTSRAPSPIESRFSDNIIKISLPDKQQREQIISYYIKRMGDGVTSSEDISASILAEKTEGFSHRHLEKLVKTALQRSINTDTYAAVTMNDYIQAITTIKNTDSQLNGKKKWNKRTKKITKWVLGAAAIAIPLAVQYWMNQKNLDAQAKAHAQALKDQKEMSKKHDKLQEKSLEMQETSTALSILAFGLQAGKATIDVVGSIANFFAKHRDPSMERYNRPY